MSGKEPKKNKPTQFNVKQHLRLCVKRRGPTPNGTHNTPAHRAEKGVSVKNSWLEIDKDGLSKTLGQKDKVFLLTEMVSNAWDENITQVEVSLTSPDENRFSWLRVTDNSPTGWADLDRKSVV